jgi:hypothetical protein
MTKGLSIVWPFIESCGSEGLGTHLHMHNTWGFGSWGLRPEASFAVALKPGTVTITERDLD